MPQAHRDTTEVRRCPSTPFPRKFLSLRNASSDSIGLTQNVMLQRRERPQSIQLWNGQSETPCCLLRTQREPMDLAPPSLWPLLDYGAFEGQRQTSCVVTARTSREAVLLRAAPVPMLMG